MLLNQTPSRNTIKKLAKADFRKGKAFTLLEVSIAILLMAVAFSFGGVKISRLLEKRRFFVDMERFQERLILCHRLAITMQSDWKGVLKKEKGGWQFHVFSEDQPNAYSFRTMKLPSYSLAFNGKPVDSLVFDFTATGLVEPNGEIVFTRDKKGAFVDTKKLELGTVFEQDRSGFKKKDLGPTHPFFDR